MKIEVNRPQLIGRESGENPGKVPAHVQILLILRPATVDQPLSQLSLAEPDRWKNLLGIDWGRANLFVSLEKQEQTQPAGPLLLLSLSYCKLTSVLESWASAMKVRLEMAAQVTEARRNEWPLPLDIPVTPLHFLFEPELRDGGPAERNCDRLAADLALAYLAERISPERVLRMVFQGYRRGEVEPWHDSIPRKSVEALCKLVKWACDERISDKLQLVENLISLRLGEDPRANYSGVLAAAPNLLKSAMSNWKVYLKDGTRQYFERQKERSDFLAIKVQQYGRTLNSTIAALAGYSITLLGFFFTNYLLEAAKADEATRHRIAGAFFLYSLIVLTILFLHAILDERILSTELKEERDRLAQLFSEEELTESMDKPIRRRKRQFKAFIYSLLGLAVLALVLLGRHISQEYGPLW